MAERLTKLANVILILVGLILLPAQIAGSVSSEFARLAIGISIGCLILLNVSELLGPIRRWIRVGFPSGLARIVAMNIQDQIELSDDGEAQITVRRELVFRSRPHESDMCDFFAKVDDQVALDNIWSSDPIVGVRQRRHNRIAVLWTPREPIVPLVPFIHTTKHQSFYGSSWFFHALYVDYPMGRFELEIRLSKDVGHVSAHSLPPWSGMINRHMLHQLAIGQSRRSCQQAWSPNPHQICWTIDEPKRWRTYVLVVILAGYSVDAILYDP